MSSCWRERRDSEGRAGVVDSPGLHRPDGRPRLPVGGAGGPPAGHPRRLLRRARRNRRGRRQHQPPVGPRHGAGGWKRGRAGAAGRHDLGARRRVSGDLQEHADRDLGGADRGPPVSGRAAHPGRRRLEQHAEDRWRVDVFLGVGSAGLDVRSYHSPDGRRVRALHREREADQPRGTRRRHGDLYRARGAGGRDLRVHRLQQRLAGGRGRPRPRARDLCEKRCGDEARARERALQPIRVRRARIQ